MEAETSLEAGDESAQQWEMARAIDQQIPAIWMVRTFLKHADESEDDEDLREVVRGLYDFILALGPLDESTDLKKYLKAAKKKRSKLKKAAEFYAAIQPEVSGHTNFEMAAKSLNVAVARIEEILARKPSPQATPSS